MCLLQGCCQRQAEWLVFTRVGYGWCPSSLRSPIFSRHWPYGFLAHRLQFYLMQALDHIRLVVQHGVALPGWVPWIWKGAQSFSELAFPYILWPSHLLRAQTQVCDVGRAGKKGSKETTEVRPFTLTHWLRTWLVHLETLLLLWVVLFFFCFLSMTEHIWIFWGTELRLKTWNTVCCYLF